MDADRNAFSLGRVLILLILAAVAYAPALGLPFIDDDYTEIPRALSYSSVGWSPLWHDADLRTRATSMGLNAAIGTIWGFTPAPYYAVSILVHALCVLLIYATGIWSEVLDTSTTFWAAAFFAVYERHQEAVMWISARSEALLFLFGMSAWVCWVKFLRTRKARWYCLALIAFVLAALSKESFPVIVVFMVAPCVSRRRAVASLAPFFAIAIGYLAWTWLSRFGQPGYFDDRFSLSSPWVLVMLRSIWRLIFVWGLLALAILWAICRYEERTKVRIALLWISVAVLPYSFLTYLPQIASRHTYLASGGLALLVGTAAARLAESNHRQIVKMIVVVVLAVNLEILWVKKLSQFQERAEPSELLKTAVRDARGPVVIRCSPLSDSINDAVAASAGGHVSFSQPGAHDDHCFTVDYTNSAGAAVSVDQRIRTKNHGMFY